MYYNNIISLNYKLQYDVSTIWLRITIHVYNYIMVSYSKPNMDGTLTSVMLSSSIQHSATDS